MILPEAPSWLGAPVKISPIELNGDPYVYGAQCLSALALANKRQSNARKFYDGIKRDYGSEQK